jgi:uncharacterized membrane protein YbhN (UPF0104 family)
MSSDAGRDPGPVADPTSDPPALGEGATPNGEAPTPPVAEAPSRRSALLRSGFIIAILIVVFGIILPRYVDYQEVLEAFQGLTVQQIAFVSVLGFLAWVACGTVFTALIPGLGMVRGLMSYLILSGIGSSVPMGPWNMAVLWVVVRGWGIENRAAASGIALYGVVDQLSRLFLPLLGIGLLAATGQLGGSQARVAWLIAIIGIVCFFVALALIIGIVRSQKLAERLGRTGQRWTEAIFRRLGRSGAPDVHGAVLRFRLQLGEVIRQRGLLALTCSILSKVMWAVVLTGSLRAVGISDQVLSFAEIFAVSSLVWIITILPISPGGAGVPEVLYITGLTTIAGSEYQNAITAGVMLYRVYQWFLPIPLAWILLKVARRGKSMLPSTSELRAAAAGKPI